MHWVRGWVGLSGLETILALNGVRYNWKKDGSPDVGLIAQDVEKVLPELVMTDSQTGLKAVKYGNIVAPLIEASKDLYGICTINSSQIKQIQRTIASHTAEIQQHQDQIKELNRKVDLLSEQNQQLRNELDEIKKLLKSK